MIPSLTIATWLTMSRLLALPLAFVWAHALTDSHRKILAVVFIIASLTDALDGYVARKYNQVTDFGKFLDPLVDKLLVIAYLLVLHRQISTLGLFLILARELIITAWRGGPNSAVKAAKLCGKVKAAWQMLTIMWLLLNLPYGMVVFWICVALTLVSGATYLMVKEKKEGL